jgi:hypothetical protein
MSTASKEWLALWSRIRDVIDECDNECLTDDDVKEITESVMDLFVAVHTDQFLRDGYVIAEIKDMSP